MKLIMSERERERERESEREREREREAINKCLLVSRLVIKELVFFIKLSGVVIVILDEVKYCSNWHMSCDNQITLTFFF